MADPLLDGEQIEQPVVDVGLRPIRLGDLDAVPVLDAATRLWFALARQPQWGRRHGLRVLRGSP